MKKNLLIVFLLFSSFCLTNAQNYKVIESNEKFCTIEFNFQGKYRVVDSLINGTSFTFIKGDKYPIRKYGEPWLPLTAINLGVPENSNPTIQILSSETEKISNKFVVPVPKEDPYSKPINIKDLNYKIYQANQFFPSQPCSIENSFIVRYAKAISVSISPFQFNPVSRELIYFKKIRIKITFNAKSNLISKTISNNIEDNATNEIINSTFVNSNVAGNFIISKSNNINKSSKLNNSYWYNPNKEYYKIFLNKKGVYRLTYNDLSNSGINVSGLQVNKIEIYNSGKQIPLYINDKNQNNVFDSDDYIEFVGFPAPATNYASLNIYNNSNVYWFSSQSDSSGLRYNEVNAFPVSWERDFTNSYDKLHFEKDSIYERLGYATDDHRDYWYWGKASSYGGSPLSIFEDRFPIPANFSPDSSMLKLKINMHGINYNSYCNFGTHQVLLSLSDQPLDTVVWTAQESKTWERTIRIKDNIHLYSDANILDVVVKGDLCYGSDEIDVNWYELEFYKDLRALNGNHLNFFSPPDIKGVQRFWTWSWNDSIPKVFIPSENKLIVKGDSYFEGNSATFKFVDTLSSQKEYFCKSDSYFLQVDSIQKDISSNLRDVSNAADYIIITHRKFTTVAEQLKSMRESNPIGTISNPRVKIVYTDEIYDEFSYGLLDPYALQAFTKYAFENWVSPAPAYVVLLGDMSYDYRHLLKDSRDNYVPSIPYHAPEYGQAVADNSIVCVEGNDYAPDLAIGRLSCETVDEGMVLINKLKFYPADNSKEWKQNVLLFSSGMDEKDENYFGFNDASVSLEDKFVTPNGLTSTKIMRFPNKAEYMQYKGSGPEIRNAFNNGGVIANYYGHGGGYQWDLTFINDDIFQLENGNKLPFISSVTCYTAHFDNQDVFGEQFMKIPNKGCIGFLGSSGLTFWGSGPYINELIFDQILNNKAENVGKAIMNGKITMMSSPNTVYATTTSLLTYLGDPALKLAIPDKPDFRIKTADITFSSDKILKKDTLSIKVKIDNLGRTFSDSVAVELVISGDTTYSLGTKLLPSFGELDSLYYTWIPIKGGLYNVTAKINENNRVPEDDHSDNLATNSVVVYDISEPNLLTPFNGAVYKNNAINFSIMDIGHYLNLDFKYQIQVDTAYNMDVDHPYFLTSLLIPENGILKYTNSTLLKGIYFWRARIFDGKSYGVWSDPRYFTITDDSSSSYLANKNILKKFNNYNVFYDETSKSLVLNNQLLPPKPVRDRFLEDITIDSLSHITDSVGLTTITTDGTYIYFGNMWYYQGGTSNSKIYKLGTGYNGTVKGKLYGSLGDFYDRISNSIFYYKNNIYAAIGKSDTLAKIDVATGILSYVKLPVKMLRKEDAREIPGNYYLNSDGKYVYNITVKDTLGNNKYVLRTFDPENNWQLAKPDITLAGTSYVGFTSFFVAENLLYVTENYEFNMMRSFNLTNGAFLEEWYVDPTFQSYYAWTYDNIHDVLFTSVYRGNFKSKISKYSGRYLDAQGKIITDQIGPASKWNNINYNITYDEGHNQYRAFLEGLNKVTNKWDTLKTNVPSSTVLDTINALNYPYLRMAFNLVDSSFGVSKPITFSSLSANYKGLPELYLNKNDLTFTPDTIQQGFNTNMNFTLHNIGFENADSVKIKFYYNSADSAFYTYSGNVPKDSSIIIKKTIESASMAPATLYDTKVVADYNKLEYYSFNNTISKSFYVSRDSISPKFRITIDGKEIINGDVVSANPEIVAELTDDSPLPLKPEYFTMIFEGEPLTIAYADTSISDTVPKFYSTAYPNNSAKIIWKPKLKDGTYTLEIIAKDASGNFFDSTASRTVFEIYNQFDFLNVYNYPNPFKDNTYFTFTLRGDYKNVEQCNIKIFTVAGRLIRNMDIPSSQLKSGFNKLYWDGKDQDGDNISNGVYLYKVNIKSGGQTKSVTQKLAKVK